MSNPSITPRHDGWSEVRANGQAIRYRRCGAGRTVLVLRPDATADHPSSPRSPLLEVLGRHFRLLMPELPAAGVDLPGRLALFLDGVGATDVAVLAFGDLCLPALELALLGGDQIARLALVPDGGSDTANLDGSLVTSPGQMLPLMVVRDLGRWGEDLTALTRFLEDTPPERPLARL